LTLDEKTNLSKSKNSPWFKQSLIGKTVAVFNNDKQWLDL
jgi:dihydroorotase